MFSIGQHVYVKNNGAASAWLIVESTGPVSFRVLLGDGHEWRCHQDHLHQADQPSSRMGGVIASDFMADSNIGSDTSPATEELLESNKESIEPTWRDSLEQSTVTAPTIARAYPKRMRVPLQQFEPKL